ncbi:MAG: hypothetical protein ACI8ZM_004402 [Crocinitomix sp.]|jgi:hypothetical protein
MSIKAAYKLNFGKIVSQGHSDFYVCNWSNEIEGSLELGELLQTLADEESQFFLEELNIVIVGEEHEAYYSLDQAIHVWVDFSPPNAVISDTFTISLIDLKELIEDWIAFVKQ